MHDALTAFNTAMPPSACACCSELLGLLKSAPASFWGLAPWDLTACDSDRMKSNDEGLNHTFPVFFVTVIRTPNGLAQETEVKGAACVNLIQLAAMSACCDSITAHPWDPSCLHHRHWWQHSRAPWQKNNMWLYGHRMLPAGLATRPCHQRVSSRA